VDEQQATAERDHWRRRALDAEAQIGLLEAQKLAVALADALRRLDPQAFVLRGYDAWVVRRARFLER
jgi:hypothetical protein